MAKKDTNGTTNIYRATSELAMPTVIFDFDSTLISCESLELILKDKIKNKPDLAKQIHELTEQGMGGLCSFAESLAKRLAIAQPSLKDVQNFAKSTLETAAPGMENLINDLKKGSVDIWIVSGALRETLLPLAQRLKIPPDKTCGVQLQWKEDGEFGGIDSEDPFSRSKVEGARLKQHHWSHPIISIGDGMTDYALFENGLVDHFIAFTQYARRQNLIKKGVKEAKNVPELRKILGSLLNGNIILS